MDSQSPIERATASTDRRAGSSPRGFWIAGLFLLCLFTYLPGALRLPAVDRTEVVWADTTRAMVETGDWLHPAWRGTVHAFRPIGTFWAQGLAAKAAGDDYARDIRIYRLPGVLAVTLAVLALFLLSAPLVGTAAAGIAAGLFAVAPLTVLLSQLAIADGLALLPATVAMLALLRIYTAQEEAETLPIALLFWAAAGAGMLVNALHTPILVCVTLMALYGLDRDLSWLKRLHASKGLPLAFALGAPWIVVRALQDGVPFAGLDLGKLLAALGGAQDMKLRAFPGTFLLAALLGFLPGTALLAAAMLRMWEARHDRVPRFLIAWIAGYIVYLELVSSKPGTYTVQVMFPAMALAVALLVVRASGRLPTGESDAPPSVRASGRLPAGESDAPPSVRASGRLPTGESDAPPKWHALPWPPLAGLFAVTLFAAPYAAMREMPPWWIVPFVLAVAALFYWSAKRGREGALRDWAAAGIAALALFAVSLTSLVMPSIDRIWPARQIARALEGCAPGPLAVAGFREPSAYFVLGHDERLLEPDALREALVAAEPGYVAAEVRDDKARALGRFQYRRMRAVACVEAYNTMRGCPLFFTIQATGPTVGCKALEAFPCTGEFQTRAQAAREKKGCD